MDGSFLRLNWLQQQRLLQGKSSLFQCTLHSQPFKQLIYQECRLIQRLLLVRFSGARSGLRNLSRAGCNLVKVCLQAARLLGLLGLLLQLLLKWRVWRDRQG